MAEDRLLPRADEFTSRLGQINEARTKAGLEEFDPEQVYHAYGKPLEQVNAERAGAGYGELTQTEYDQIQPFGEQEHAYQQYAQMPAEYRSQGIGGDFSRMLGAGMSSLGQMGAFGLEKLGLDTRHFQQAMARSAERQRSEYTPETQEAVAKKFVPGEGEGGSALFDPRALLAVGVESLPAMAAGIGAGGLLARAGMAGVRALGAGTIGQRVATGLGYGAGESAVAGPAAGAQIAAQFDAIKDPETELADSPAYQQLRASGVSPEQAVETLRDQASTQAMGEAAAWTAVLGAPAATFMPGLLGRIGQNVLRRKPTPGATPKGGIYASLTGPAKTRLGEVGKAAAFEGAQEAGQSFGETVAQNRAVADYIDPTQNLLEGGLEAAVGGAVAGAGMGAPLGVLSYRKPVDRLITLGREKAQVEREIATIMDDEQQAQEAAQSAGFTHQTQDFTQKRLDKLGKRSDQLTKDYAAELKARNKQQDPERGVAQPADQQPLGFGAGVVSPQPPTQAAPQPVPPTQPPSAPPASPPTQATPQGPTSSQPPTTGQSPVGVRVTTVQSGRAEIPKFEGLTDEARATAKKIAEANKLKLSKNDTLVGPGKQKRDAVAGKISRRLRADEAFPGKAVAVEPDEVLISDEANADQAVISRNKGGGYVVRTSDGVEQGGYRTKIAAAKAAAQVNNDRVDAEIEANAQRLREAQSAVPKEGRQEPERVQDTGGEGDQLRAQEAGPPASQVPPKQEVAQTDENGRVREGPQEKEVPAQQEAPAQAGRESEGLDRALHQAEAEREGQTRLSSVTIGGSVYPRVEGLTKEGETLLSDEASKRGMFVKDGVIRGGSPDERSQLARDIAKRTPAASSAASHMQDAIKAYRAQGGIETTPSIYHNAQTGEFYVGNDAPSGYRQVEYKDARRLEYGGQTSAEVQRDISRDFGARHAAAVQKSGKLRIVQSEGDLPSEFMSQPQVGGVKPKGVYDPATDTVWLVADNIRKGEVKATYMHEVGHSTLEEMLGKRAWNDLSAQVDKLYSSGDAYAERAKLRMGAKIPASLKKEEQITYLLEEYVSDPKNASPGLRAFVRRVLNAVRAWWYKTAAGKGIGPRMNITPADVAALARMAVNKRGRDAIAKSVTPDLQSAASIASNRAANVPPSMAGTLSETDKLINFDVWFGDSQVVDENGDPLVVYHGTNEEFNEFTAGEFGFHFGDRAAADMMGEAMEVYIRIENPLRMRDIGAWDPENVLDELSGIIFEKENADAAREEVKKLKIDLQDALDNDYDMVSQRQAYYKMSEPVRNLLKENGYDGIVYANEAEGFSDSYIVLDPSQIKSATNNIGTYSSTNKDIRYSIASNRTAPVPPVAHTAYIGIDDEGQAIPVSTSNPEVTQEKGWLKKTVHDLFYSRGLMTKDMHQEWEKRTYEQSGDQVIAEFATHDLMRAAMKHYGKWRWDLIDEKHLAEMNDYLQGNDKANIPDSFKPHIDYMRNVLDRLSTDIQGVLLKETEYMIERLPPEKRAMARLLFKEIEGASDLRDAMRIGQGYKTSGGAASALTAMKKNAKTPHDRAVLEGYIPIEEGGTWSLAPMTEQELMQHYMEGIGSDAKRIASKIKTFYKIKSNKGIYLHRSYAAFDDPKWHTRINLEQHDKAKEYIRAQILKEDRFKRLRDPANEADLEARVDAIYKSITQPAEKDMLSFMYSSMAGQEDRSILFRRKEIDPSILAVMGEYKDPRINFARSLTKMSYLVANHNFLNGVRLQGLKEGGYLSTEETGPFTKQISKPDDETMGPLAGLYTTEDIAKSLHDIVDQKVTTDYVRALLALNSAIKFGMTPLAPTTSARNFWSGAMMNWMNGNFTAFDQTLPALKTAWKDMWAIDQGIRPYLERLTRLGVLHTGARHGELKAAIEDFTDLDVTKGSMAKRSFKGAMRIAAKFYQFGDDFWKIVAFEDTKRQFFEYYKKQPGMSEQEASDAAEKRAAYRVKNGYPTYTFVPGGIRWLRKFPLAGPFVSFPWEIMRTTKNNILFMMEDFKEGRTEMAWKRALGMGGLATMGSWMASTISMYLNGISDEDDEAVRAVGQKWRRNSQLLYLGRDEKDNIVTMDLSHLDPYTYIKTPFTALANGQYEGIGEKMWAGISALLAPFIGAEIGTQALGEIWANKKVESGRPVYDDLPDVPLYVQGKQVFDHLLKSWSPGVVNNVRNILSAYSDEYSSWGKKYDLGDEGFAAIGFRFTTQDTSLSLRYRAYEFNDFKRAAGNRLYKAMRNINLGKADDVKDAYKGAQIIWKASWKDMIASVRAAKVIGLTRAEIARNLAIGKVARKDIPWLLREEIPPWKPAATSLRNAHNAVYIKRRDSAMRAEMRERMRALREVATQSSGE